MSRFRGFALAIVLTCAAAAPVSGANPPSIGTITTVAGTGTGGFGGDAGQATGAQLNIPKGVVLDSAGNIYFADYNNHRVRKITKATGIISTVAGTGTGGYNGDNLAATSAQLFYPTGVAVAASGDVYIADQSNHRVRKVAAASGLISTIAGTGTAGYGADGVAATASHLYNPTGVALDLLGNVLIADASTSKIRRVSSVSGLIFTIAGTGATGYNGDGVPTMVTLTNPMDVAVDGSGNIYIADTYNSRIRKISAETNLLTTIAGSGVAGYSGEAGPATTAKLNGPTGIAVDGAGNVYIADLQNSRVRMLVAATGLLHTVAGNSVAGFAGDGGLATAAQVNLAADVAVDSTGTLYITDWQNHRLRKVTPSATPTPLLTTVAGTGTSGYNGEGLAVNAQLDLPVGVAVDAAGNVYVSELNSSRVRKIAAGTRMISTIAGNGDYGYGGDGGPATSAFLYDPRGLAVDAAGNVYIADQSNNRVRKVTAATGVITTVAGTGTYGYNGDGIDATSAHLRAPSGVAVDAAGNLYIADLYNNRVRKVTIASGRISTVAGNGSTGAGGDGGAATSAQLWYPGSVALDAAGNLFIADTDNHRVRKVAAATGIISTIAGTRVSGYQGENSPAIFAKLNFPTAVSADAAGNVYITEPDNHRVRAIWASTGFITTVAGSGDNAYGGDGGAATAGQFIYPDGLAVDSAGAVYIADSFNHRVRRAGIPVVAPSDLRVTRAAPTVVLLSWTAVPGATGYVVKRGSSTGGETFLAGGITSTSVYSPGTLGARYFYVVSAMLGAIETPNSNEVSIVLAPNASVSDADGDAKAEIVVYRPATGDWYLRNSSSGYNVGGGNWYFNWGLPGDLPVQADYDGDGRMDMAVYRPSTGEWFIRYSSHGYGVGAGLWYFQWGLSGDLPKPADYDGDGMADVAVYRPSTGEWYIRNSSQGYAVGAGNWYFQWGLVNDLAKPGDYDGDGRADLAVYRPTTGQWLIRNSSQGYVVGAGNWHFQWGLPGDTAIVGDFDSDGWIDPAVYRPTTGEWLIRLSTLGYAVGAGNWYFQWGLPGDVPIVSDFDGDGKVDPAVYRPSSGEWFLRLSSQGYGVGAGNWYFQWGLTGDTALP